MDSRLDAHRIWVRPSYRLFSLADPTCEECENYHGAIQAAGTDIVGWAANAVVVNAVSDLVDICVDVALWPGPPAAEEVAGPTEPQPDLIRDGQLALPGGVFCVPEAVQAQFRLAVEIPTGPGTYAVRVAGFHRAQARQIRDDALTGPGPFTAVASAALRGVECYRLYLWQLRTSGAICGA
jgi:hypothetical protein